MLDIVKSTLLGVFVMLLVIPAALVELTWEIFKVVSPLVIPILYYSVCIGFTCAATLFCIKAPFVPVSMFVWYVLFSTADDKTLIDSE